ncbi:HtaA domain-containing protein [Canibacter zhoujuaniae]|uniref:HtaA domain-containing protein n=1 Tax=Canibacter zhoujuaniae TaxID=2708343 RepID=UPI001422EE05|nr:HtaA domain-containing protein [Canibacter zhoujuaniae]
MQKTSIKRTFATVVAAGAVASSLVLVPATIAAAHDEAEHCQVTDGTLTWGVKTSFRSYISGSIANGAWEVSEGAAYETPDFIFGGGSGEGNPSDLTVGVSMPGKVQFTGHNGVLNLIISNPTVRLDGAESATLLLDVYSNDTSGKEKVNAKQVEMAHIDTSKALELNSETWSINGAPATLTEAGAEAFGGYYVAGEELDPITLTAGNSTCVKNALSGGEAAEESDSADSKTAMEESQAAPVVDEQKPANSGTNWVPIAISAVAGVAVVGAGIALLRGGKKRTEQ